MKLEKIEIDAVSTPLFELLLEIPVKSLYSFNHWALTELVLNVFNI